MNRMKLLVVKMKQYNSFVMYSVSKLPFQLHIFYKQ